MAASGESKGDDFSEIYANNGTVEDGDALNNNESISTSPPNSLNSTQILFKEATNDQSNITQDKRDDVGENYANNRTVYEGDVLNNESTSVIPPANYLSENDMLLKETTNDKSNITVSASACSVTSNNTDFEEHKYIPPCEDPYEKAWKYLSKHNILHLFQGVTANVFYRKPKDPLEDIVQQIQKLQDQDSMRKGVIKISPYRGAENDTDVL